MAFKIIQNGIKIMYEALEVAISWKNAINFLKLLMLHYTDLFSIQQRYWGGDLYPALIFPRTSGRKRPKHIERHIQFRDNGTRIMRWKIGPAPAQTDRKNILPATKYEGWLGGRGGYRWLRNNNGGRNDIIFTWRAMSKT